MIRLGGNAELTIQYTDYQITSADAVGTLTPSKPVQTADPGVQNQERWILCLSYCAPLK